MLRSPRVVHEFITWHHKLFHRYRRIHHDPSLVEITPLNVNQSGNVCTSSALNVLKAKGGNEDHCTRGGGGGSGCLGGSKGLSRVGSLFSNPLICQRQVPWGRWLQINTVGGGGVRGHLKRAAS